MNGLPKVDYPQESVCQILLVEDDKLDKDWIQALLKRIPHFKFEITWAQTYAESRSLLCDQTFDIALVDYAIGAYSGVDLLVACGGREALHR
ncbi:response regulator [Kordiimonas aquimaris]|uniref:hypothetical protein n=1 Tax=Kordiimonas aquimaris TaxID=707591 RepID=UPI0021D39059|nr:hypothetical protein [Kordiimonas aquimaris]